MNDVQPENQRGAQQNNGGNRQRHSRNTLARHLHFELFEIEKAGTAVTEVVEPFLGLVQADCAKRNSF